MIEKAGKKVGVKILIAEDEMIVAEDLALTLQDLGYRVAGMASTGEGAVQLAKESKPTLVLMDIKMAGDIDGIEASEQIRTRLDIPVIFLTAYDEVDVLRRAKRTEPYGFVAKPFSHHILKITIETALYKHAADRRVRESEARRAKAEELAGLHSWEWDIKTGHLVWSDESYRAFGLHPRDPELTFDTFLNSVHADDRERLRKALEDALDTIRPYDLEFRIVQSNGQERFLHSRGEIQRDEDGKPIRMQGMALDITDRKHAEEARRQSDDRFRMVYESGMLGMGFCDPDGRVLDANDAYLDMIRLSREDLLNNRINWREITPPEHLPADLNGLEELMANGRCTPYEKEYLLLDGTRVPVIIGGALLPGGSSEVIAFALDITDRKRAEEALRESEDRYRDLVENIKDLVCTHDLHGNLLFVNQAPAKLLGYAPADMVGTNLRSYLAPEVRDQFEAYLAAIRKDGQASGLMLVQTKGGEKRIWEYRNTLRTEGVVDPTVRGIARDITDQRRAEAMLKASEQRLALALAGANLGIWEWDLVTGKALWGERTLQVLGYEPNEFEPNLKNWKKLIHSEDWPRVSENLNLHIEGKLPMFEAEYRILNKSGDWQWVQARGNVIGLDADGKPARMAGVVADISDRKKSEEALRASEKAHKTLAENIPGIVYRVHFDDQATMEFFNHEVESITGFSENELRKGEVCSIDPLILPEDRPKVAGLVKQAFDENTPFEVEYRIRDKNGAIRHFVEYGRPIRGAAGSQSFINGVIFDITDRKRAEEALRISEDRFSKAFQASPDVLVISRRDTGQIIETNEKWESTFGYKRPEVIGRTSFELGLFENPDVRSHAIHLLQEQGFLRDFEVNIRKKSGEIRQTLLSAESIEVGGNPCMLTIIRDITDRKQAEEALRESREQLETIFETSPAGIILVSPEGLITFANKKMGDLFSRRSEDLLGTPYVDLVHPSQRSIGYEKMKALMAGEIDQVSLERRYQAADGREFLGHLSGRRILREYGALEGLVGIITDITDRKKAEKALLESEERYRQITESSLTGIFLYQDGRSIYANRRLAEMVGYSPEEILNIPFLEAVHPDDRHKVQEMAKARLSGQPVPNHYQLRLLHKDGHTIWTEVLSHRIDYEGRPAILGNIADVTESRILRQQLFQAQKMEAVGILAGGVAHDFNNLLHIIAGHAELLEMELAEKDMRFGEVDAIRQAANRGANLVKQILTFSRKVDTNFESINLNEDVRDTERLLYRTIPKMIEIVLSLEEGLRPVRADSTQIEQMLINLTVNAKDAMPEGGKLTIETKNVHLDEHYCRSQAEIVPGQYVLLKVSDTGHGMEEDVRQHIFEPFFTTKGLANGTGLGLATVFGIVKMHGGHITCESEVGKGTTFAIYFPVAEAAKPELDHKQEVSAVAGGTERILVVDDEPLIRDLAKRILEKAGYSVITAGSGKEGIEIYAQHKSEIALVILDLIMPEMGGKQCLEELLKINPQVKALIASGFAVKGDTKDFLDTEAKGIVPKPFNMRELLRAVRHVLDGV